MAACLISVDRHVDGSASNQEGLDDGQHSPALEADAQNLAAGLGPGDEIPLYADQGQNPGDHSLEAGDLVKEGPILSTADGPSTPLIVAIGGDKDASTSPSAEQAGGADLQTTPTVITDGLMEVASVDAIRKHLLVSSQH